MSRPSASQSRSWSGGYINASQRTKTSLRRCAVTLVAVVSNGLFGADHDLGLWDGDRFLSCYRALLEEYGGTSNLVVDPALSGAVERTDLERSSSAEPESSSSEAPVSQKNAVSYMAARLTSLHSYAVASYHLPHCRRSWSCASAMAPCACHLSQ
jgi:hypothetical protein